MDLFDVNVLLNAHRPDLEHHRRARAVVEETISDPAPFGVSPAVLAGFIRISTNRRAFPAPTPIAIAFEAANRLISRPNARLLSPTSGGWQIFESLCSQTQATGKLVADAHHAALAIEHGCRWISFDRDFAKFPELDWHHPLDA